MRDIAAHVGAGVLWGIIGALVTSPVWLPSVLLMLLLSHAD